ncbi:acyl-CoA dehydrogenase [Streptoalloteichus tenebrarius]|uniref:Acyl-CoA dehydrogenase n=1 Tax=Streptoalloteichus tenebrarius (strain ATCC 17920 / DSM 40477 / JCM 4838 / CBS 697.72 / NBRC 16177 / NCIMB 11028 / NRRL B-12390 / A12253. 1 / ISP 5477) TaxID=1933 RepID=A0ABT1HYY5_STRSD|nr:acyl-CoA dehydrogenase family protein [Streptoalloteichus tenebrarius]MCP2260740.1 acyl-CoA dehydrogenase [Streptoalloteichus tenebrarius]BFF03449.1 acyl-CoA dehydrogenase family protein [Streptoalloteichus tenebrarius]
MRRVHYEPGHEEYRSAFRGFLQREVVPHQERWLAEGIVDREVWRSAGKHGFLLPWADERHGGLGLTGFRYEQVLIEELAAIGETGLAIPLHSAVVAPYLAAHGTPEQRDRWLPGAVSGDVVLALAITEPGTGSDVAGMTTRAERDGDHWVITGSKTFISNGVHADLVIVAARTDPEQRHAVGLFLVESGAPGFARGRKLDKLGMRSQDTAELFFDGVRVGPDAVLGDPAQGFGAIMGMFAQERLTVAAGCVAGAEAALRLAVEHARRREAFGRPLAKFQDIRFRLAQMRTEVDVALAFVDRCVLAHEAGDLGPADAAEAKLFASEVLGRVVDEAVQIHGGMGFMWEHPVCRAYADARVQRIYAGTSEIMKEIVGRAMLG